MGIVFVLSFPIGPCVYVRPPGERVFGCVCVLKESIFAEKSRSYKGVNVILFGAIKEANAKGLVIFAAETSKAVKLGVI